MVNVYPEPLNSVASAPSAATPSPSTLSIGIGLGLTMIRRSAGVVEPTQTFTEEFTGEFA